MTHSGSIPAKLIKLCSKSKYSHVSISIDKNLNALYSFGRKSPKNPLNGGFAIDGINEGIYKVFKNTYCKIYKIMIDDEKYDRFMEILNYYLDNQDQYKYNFIGLITVLIHIPYRRENYYFCSQFVSEVLDKSEIYKFNKDFTLIKPNDFNELKNFELIFEGKLNDYKKILLNKKSLEF
jgi:hypothetical protein